MSELEILEIYKAYGICDKDSDIEIELQSNELDNRLNTNFVSGYDETLRDKITISNSTDFRI